jgi:hypothetical protein
MNDRLGDIVTPLGEKLPIISTRLPEDHSRYMMKWDGEWQITYEVFRDMGIAFAAVMVLIYILVVGWFGSFVTPFIIMAPIPLTLIGILPAHGALGVFFTATSMIGFIALAGVIVRNSILLVDFVNLELASGERSRPPTKAGRPLPADRAHRRRIGGRRRGDLPRPHLPGARGVADLRSRRVDGSDPDHHPGALLHVPEDRWNPQRC